MCEMFVIKLSGVQKYLYLFIKLKLLSPVKNNFPSSPKL